MQRIIVLMILTAMLATPAQAQDAIPDQERPAESTGSSPQTPAPPMSTPLLFEDNFDNPDTGRLPKASPQAERFGRGYVDGHYAIQVYDSSWTGGPLIPLPGTYTDASISIDVRGTGELTARTAALECRREAQNNYRAVLDLQRSRVRLVKTVDRAQTVLQEFANAGQLNPSEWVRFELACAGEVIVVSINGLAAIRAQDGSYVSGGLGFGIGGNPGAVDMRFDNLAVTQREPADLPAAVSPELIPASDLVFGKTIALVSADNPRTTRSGAPPVGGGMGGGTTPVVFPAVVVRDPGPVALSGVINVAIAPNMGIGYWDLQFHAAGSLVLASGPRRLVLRYVTGGWQLRYGEGNVEQMPMIAVITEGSNVSFALRLDSNGRTGTLTINGQESAFDLGTPLYPLTGARRFVASINSNTFATTNVTRLDVSMPAR